MSQGLLLGLQLTGLFIAAYFAQLFLRTNQQAPSFGVSIIFVLIPAFAVGAPRVFLTQYMGSGFKVALSSLLLFFVAAELNRRLLLVKVKMQVKYGKVAAVSFGAALVMTMPTLAYLLMKNALS